MNYKHYIKYNSKFLNTGFERSLVPGFSRSFSISLSFSKPFINMKTSTNLLFKSLNNITGRSNTMQFSTKSWNHPQTYFQIALACIYPLLGGLYLSILRYLRLGFTIDTALYLDYLNPNVVVFLLLLIYYFYPLIMLMISIIQNIRNLLWQYTTSLLYTIHIHLLRYYCYFRLCELIYKAHFLYHDIFSGSVGATTWDLKKVAVYRRIISYIYYHANILTLVIFSFILGELILCHGKLYFSIYLLFIYPLIFSIFRCFSLFGFTNFIKDVCLCDYLTHNFISPRYPLIFWHYLAKANYHYGFEQRFNPDLVDILGRTVLLESIAYKHFIKFHWNLMYRVWGHKRITIKEYPYQITKVTGYPKRWSVRVAAVYLHRKNVRWYHTTRILYSPLPEKLHPLTIHFVKNNPYAILGLLNHPTTKFSQVQQLTKNLKWPEIHKTIPNILVETGNKSLIDVLEINFVLRFKSLAKNGVIIGTYRIMKKTFTYKDLDTMQMRAVICLLIG